jgi:signal transduction histidine kinase
MFSHLSATLLAVVFVIGMFQFDLEGLKGFLVDLQIRSQWWTTPYSDVVLIGYDDTSAYRYDGNSSKIPVEEFAQVFDFLGGAHPKAVGIVATVGNRQYTPVELALLSKAFRKVPNTFIGYTEDDLLGHSAPQLLSGVVSYSPGFVSRDVISYGEDSVTRRVMVSIDGIPTLYQRLASLVNPAFTGESFRYEKIGESLQTFIQWQGPPGTYPILPSRNVAEHLVPAQTFTGKVVLIGSVRQAERAADYILTPYSRRSMQTPMLEGAAQGLVTLIRDDGMFRLPSWVELLISLVIGVLSVNMLLYLPPGRGIFFLVGLVAALSGAVWLALASVHAWVDLAHPLLVAGFSYYLVIPYRLLDEYRKRWHYQEKSELMSQLEQLKSNFLSLISHDLKTPIARIQGNAELVLDQTSSLTDKQKKSLSAIVHTTEDLSEYVESVLDLTRIESAKVPLNKATKDINATILEVVENKQGMAADKQIELVTDLEPIFSFKFDVKLIRRVLGNLVENAIKYSPDGTQITLRSKEEGTWVRVYVEDQGIGIAPEDQERVFAKFYRCENSTTTQNKGTGLGLYLVKYFVELHQGMVELKSEIGKGSVFTVSLPV